MPSFVTEWKSSENTMSIHQNTIQETILKLLGTIAPEADLNQLKADEDLRAALGIDSFDFLNLMIGLNEALGVEIPEADYGKLVTLNDLEHYLASHVR
jgi:acyl carrier protein